MYARLVPFLVLLMQQSSDGADLIIILLKLPSTDNIFQGSKEVKICGHYVWAKGWMR